MIVVGLIFFRKAFNHYRMLVDTEVRDVFRSS